jgi:hypothetical protein
MAIREKSDAPSGRSYYRKLFRYVFEGMIFAAIASVVAWLLLSFMFV